MLRYISDTETDGLLPTVTKIHCAVLKNIDTGAVRGFRPHEIEEYLEELERADEVWFHNMTFDYNVIKKIYPQTKLDRSKIRDTMVLARLVHPDIKQTDYERAANWKAYEKHLNDVVEWDTNSQLCHCDEVPDLCDCCFPPEPQWHEPVPKPFPGKLIGSYSLAAWGYRLGEHKGDYDGGWEAFNEPMFDYMLQDAEVTFLLYQRLMAHSPAPQALELEHRIAWLCWQIEQNGFPFDMRAAAELLAKLVDEREAVRRSLVGLFPNWRVRLPDFIPKVNNKTKGYVKGEAVERWKEFEFNPASRDHIENRLKAKYNWRPTELTDGGKAKIDDDVLASLPFPEAKQLARFFLLDKRISQLSEGGQGWMALCTPEGKIHARYTPLGAQTGRSTHSKPNISAVPRVSSEFGRDCRALFHAPAGWVQLGADQQGLELRCLASDLALAGDGGAYAKIVLEGDVHTANQIAAGLPTRDAAKTFIYAFIYGGGDEKLGSIAGAGRTKGRLLRETFLSSTPGLKTLINTVKGVKKGQMVNGVPAPAATGAQRGWIKGIDKRVIKVRSDHAALNYRLQNAGAVICKQWGCDWDDQLQAAGLKHGWDGDYVFMSWSHDEYQLAVRDNPETIELVRAIGIKTGREAGLLFGFACPLDVEVKVGVNWAETH